MSKCIFIVILLLSDGLKYPRSSPISDEGLRMLRPILRNLLQHVTGIWKWEKLYVEIFVRLSRK